MTAALSRQELPYRFRRLEKRVGGKFLLAGKFLPESLEAAGMARKSSHVAVPNSLS